MGNIAEYLNHNLSRWQRGQFRLLEESLGKHNCVKLILRHIALFMLFTSALLLMFHCTKYLKSRKTVQTW
jgi:hypothetical protein